VVVYPDEPNGHLRTFVVVHGHQLHHDLAGGAVGGPVLEDGRWKAPGTATLPIEGSQDPAKCSRFDPPVDCGERSLLACRTGKARFGRAGSRKSTETAACCRAGPRNHPSCRSTGVRKELPLAPGDRFECCSELRGGTHEVRGQWRDLPPARGRRFASRTGNRIEYNVRPL
jgi:hypothetical protein